MRFEDANRLGQALIEALGIPNEHGVTAIDIRIRVGEIPTVDVEFYPSEEAIRRAEHVWRTYELVERKDPTDPLEGALTAR